MLNTLRSKRKAILWVLVVIGVFAFVFFGVGGRAAAGAKDSTVAKINGKTIDYKEFSQMFDRTFQRQLDMYEKYMGYVNEKMREKLRKRTERRVINNLIDRELLLQKAKEIGFYVGVDEIKNNLKQYSAFQTNGKFDEDKWNKWIQNTPDESLSRVEKSIKEDILVRKMVDYLNDNVSVNAEEVKDYYLQQNQKIKFDYAVANTENYFDKIEVTDKKLTNYYEKKKENYRVPTKVDLKYLAINPLNIREQYQIDSQEAKAYYNDNKKNYQRDKEVKVQYVKVKANQFLNDITVNQNEIRSYYKNNPKEFTVKKRVAFDVVRLSSQKFIDEIKVTDENIKQYYKNNKEAYKVKEKARARHILFRADPDADKETKKKKYKQAKEVLKKIENGADFEKMAREYSEGPTASRGGDLGYFNRGEMVKNFENVVFDELNKNEVSDIVETRFGYHIIKLVEKEKAHYADLDDKSVYNSVKEKVKEEKAVNTLKEKKEMFQDYIKQNNSIAQLVDKSRAEIRSTEYLSKAEFRNKYGKSKTLMNAAFTLKENKISEPIIYNNTLYIFKANNIQKNYTRSLNNPEVRKDIVQKVKRKKALEKSKEMANNYYEKLNVEGVENFESTAEKLGIDVYPTGYFEAKRNEFVPGIGRNFNFIKTAFSLSYSDISKPVKISDGYVVMRLLNSRVGYIPSYKEVSNKVKKDLKLRKARKEIEKVVDNVKNRIEKEGFENSLTKKYKIETRTNKGVTKDSLKRIVRVRRKKDIKKFEENIFNLKKGEISDPIWLNKTAYIFKVNSKKDSFVKSFETVKSDLRTKYIKENAENMAMKELKDKKMQTVGPIAVSDKSSDVFTKKQLQDIADSLEKDNQIIKDEPKIYYIKNISVDKSAFEKLGEDKYNKIKQKLIKEKSNRYVKNWLDKLREESSIQIYLN